MLGCATGDGPLEGLQSQQAPHQMHQQQQQQAQQYAHRQQRVSRNSHGQYMQHLALGPPSPPSSNSVQQQQHSHAHLTSAAQRQRSGSLQPHQNPLETEAGLMSALSSANNLIQELQVAASACAMCHSLSLGPTPASRALAHCKSAQPA